MLHAHFVMVVRKLIVLVMFLTLILPITFAASQDVFPYHAFNTKIVNFGELFEEPEVITEQIVVTEEKQYHKVRFTMEGFVPNEITMDVGEKIVWINDRDTVKAMVQGTREHRNIISSLLEPKEQFNHTFDQSAEYIFIDAVVKSHVLKVYVGEYEKRDW